MTRAHVLLHRLIGVRLFNTLKGDDVCFVTMTGAGSGPAPENQLRPVPWTDGCESSSSSALASFRSCVSKPSVNPS